MSLHKTDLNLLKAFDALMQTRHVSRAAALIGMGQPGMSAALSRLRATFQDELLVKQGGEMVPTPRALALEPDVRRMLREIGRLVTEPDPFEPKLSRRCVPVRLSDLLSRLLLPELLERFDREAPGMSLEILHLGPDATVDGLERNLVELAVSTDLHAPKSIQSEFYFRDNVVVVARNGHPARETLGTLEGFLAAPQVKIAQSPIDDRFADRQLARMGRKRKIRATVPHWLAVPDIVARTDLVAILPRSIAGKEQENYGLMLIEPPFEDSSFDWSLYWRRRLSDDPAILFLRDMFLRIKPD
ncbi:LysR family transcriptional regulator [Nisaea acidiphila]|uniref:LysR family transcriptional regulator n=1 Tax=Nisaea acidiphila TaxID=1862145 RepID=A0A9J7ASC3_9PROT|nr:LysR family transcriptional regulator [Nisaea acidiphila]UUX50118.1 LysR family transcriptional regulator [Nisaea acidiphila]